MLIRNSRNRVMTRVRVRVSVRVISGMFLLRLAVVDCLYL